MKTENPFLSAPVGTKDHEPVDVAPVEPAIVGVASPFAEVDVVGGLGCLECEGNGGLWVVGAHGGAGTTTWAGLLQAVDSGQWWPCPTEGFVQVVVVARASARELQAAHQAALQWAAGHVPTVLLAGLILTPPAPGRLPKDLRALVKTVSGAYPRVWHAPWVPQWITHPYAAGVSEPVPKSIEDICVDLARKQRKGDT